MNVDSNPICANCGHQVDAVIVYNYNEHPLVFCSYQCLNEYCICDGGDDGCIKDLDCTDDTD